MWKVIIIVLVIILIAYSAGYISMPSDGFSNRGWSAAQRSYHIGESVGMTPISDYRSAGSIAASRGVFGVMPKTLISTYPSAVYFVDKTGAGNVSIPVLDTTGTLPE